MGPECFLACKSNISYCAFSQNHQEELATTSTFLVLDEGNVLNTTSTLSDLNEGNLPWLLKTFASRAVIDMIRSSNLTGILPSSF